MVSNSMVSYLKSKNNHQEEKEKMLQIADCLGKGRKQSLFMRILLTKFQSLCEPEKTPDNIRMLVLKVITLITMILERDDKKKRE